MIQVTDKFFESWWYQLHEDFKFLFDSENNKGTLHIHLPEIYSAADRADDLWKNLIKQIDHPNVCFYGSVIDDLKYAKQIELHWWFLKTVAIYKENPFLLDNLDSDSEKFYYFDLLLGTPRHHRNLLEIGIKDKNLDKLMLISKSSNEFVIHDQNLKLLFGENPVYHHPFDNSMAANLSQLPNWSNNIIATNSPFYISQFIDVGIYNQCAYSIIAESCVNNNIIFISEKTTKALIGKRLFLVFSSCGFLQHLRNLGFKTFDSIIDESYDKEQNMIKRGQMIIEQIEYLASQDQSTILKMAKPILDHNQQHAYNYLIENIPIYNNFSYNLQLQRLNKFNASSMIPI